MPYENAPQPDGPKDDSYEGVEFVPPEGLKLEGMSGEASVKWERKNGKICIVEMDGVRLKPEIESPEEEHEEDPDAPKMGLRAMDEQLGPKGTY